MMQMMMVWPDFTTSVHVQCVNFTYVLVVLLQYARDVIFDLDQVVEMWTISCVYLIFAVTSVLYRMIFIVQVILEHLPFVSEPILVCAFETEHVLVDGRVVGPSHSLPLGRTWEMVFHRHETEVRGHSSPNSHCVCSSI